MLVMYPQLGPRGQMFSAQSAGHITLLRLSPAADPTCHDLAAYTDTDNEMELA
jgi:hypothetical protein